VHSSVSKHYGWALRHAFEPTRSHNAVIVVEDDMTFSKDFLAYFQATSGLLQHDSSLWCISSWNDNGHKALAKNPQRIFRTSVFPGLGWLMSRRMWEEVAPRWPEDNWDWWLRQERVSKGRDCVVPEVSRIGYIGATMSKEMYGRTLSDWAWHTGAPVTDYGDLFPLLISNYEASLRSMVSKAAVWDWKEHPLAAAPAGGTFLLLFRVEEYARLAELLPVLAVEPRAHHHGIAEVHFKRRAFLLTDVRHCSFLPDSLREQPPPGVANVLGEPGELSCDAVCGRAGWGRCWVGGFAWLNNCKGFSETPGVGGCPQHCDLMTELQLPTVPAIVDGRCVLRAGLSPNVRAASAWKPAERDRRATGVPLQAGRAGVMLR